MGIVDGQIWIFPYLFCLVFK
uniref:Uncharacterized protein n=1 Tax=Arundo donax TaxID=35708 RepID=A0A0A9C096_ARUDO